MLDSTIVLWFSASTTFGLADSGPGDVRYGEHDVVVTSVFGVRAEADEEVARLNALNSGKGARYAVLIGRLKGSTFVVHDDGAEAHVE